jgi:transcriptional regulator with XRE-family HTH domain
MDFPEWLQALLSERGIGVRELSRMSGLSPAAISNVLNRNRGVGAEFCQAIARALKLPEEEVFLRAGLSKGPLSRLFFQLSPEQQEIILAEMRRMVEENERSTSKTSFRTAPNRI